jgi:hypothetical protein
VNLLLWVFVPPGIISPSLSAEAQDDKPIRGVCDKRRHATFLMTQLPKSSILVLPKRPLIKRDEIGKGITGKTAWIRISI